MSLYNNFACRKCWYNGLQYGWTVRNPLSGRKNPRVCIHLYICQFPPLRPVNTLAGATVHFQKLNEERTLGRRDHGSQDPQQQIGGGEGGPTHRPPNQAHQLTRWPSPTFSLQLSTQTQPEYLHIKHFWQFAVHRIKINHVELAKSKSSSCWADVPPSAVQCFDLLNCCRSAQSLAHLTGTLSAVTGSQTMTLGVTASPQRHDRWPSY